jgi:tripartite-type tricarboxylate transporter receptor subunit TctC
VVPYKTPPQMLLALMNGEVQVGVYTPLVGVAPMVAAGKLRLLAVTSEERDPAWPDVPTFAEIGVNLPLRTWFAILAPAGTPKESIGWMNAQYNALAAGTEFRKEVLLPNGISFVRNTPEQLSAWIRDSRSGFVELLKVVPVKAD